MEAKRKEDEESQDILPLAPLSDDDLPDVQVLGTGGLLTRLARCCNPIPDEPIVGYVTRGKGITVHRRDCPNAINPRNPERLIEVIWGTQPRTFPVRVSISVYDRAGLLHDISGVLTQENVNIASITQTKLHNVVYLSITLEVTDVVQLGRVLTRLNRVPNVIEARRQVH